MSLDGYGLGWVDVPALVSVYVLALVRWQNFAVIDHNHNGEN